MARSVPLIIRVMISVHPHASAETIGKNAAGVKRAAARAQDDQHAKQADGGRDPAAQADFFAEEDDRERGVTNSGDTKPVAEASAIGRNRKPEMKNSEEPTSAAPRSRCRPRRSVCSANSGEPGQHRRRHDQREDDEPDPGDLDRRQRCREIFCGDVGSAQKYRRGQDQRDALERPVGARGEPSLRPIFFSGKGR